MIFDNYQIKVKEWTDDVDRASDDGTAEEVKSFLSEKQESVTNDDKNEHQEDVERDDQNKDDENMSLGLDAIDVLETADSEIYRRVADDLAEISAREDTAWTAVEEIADEPLGGENEEL